MNLPRILLSILVLLAQAWPAHAAASSSAPSTSCTMGCCAAVAEMEPAACGCSEDSTPAAPAGIPPASSRDLVPQVTWALAENPALLVRPARSLPQTGWRSVERGANAEPHVRLPVLFCSFLN